MSHFRAFFPKPLVFTGVLTLFAVMAQAFPPAPHYTIYGMVRDQVGQTITAEGAELILFRDNLEVGRTPIHSELRLDQNYELNIRIDQKRSGTTLYTEKAVVAEGLFSVAVEMNGSRYLPIEAAGNLKAGKGSERVRLDLNLGEDSDGDGLPDIWEQSQLFQAGYNPDADGNWKLDLIDRDSDFDGDGQSNWREYLAGTFAGDSNEKLQLEIAEKQDSRLRFEFFAVAGKTYTLETSADGKTWARLSFAAGTASGPFGRGTVEIYRAETVGVLSAFAAPTDAPQQLFRLTVR